MAENVRIAVNAGINTISWPKRCPRCGRKDKLISADSRVVRLSAQAPTKLGAILAIRSETVHLSFLACDQHAHQNEIGVRILEKTPLISLLRLFAYVAFTFDALLLFQVVSGHQSLSTLFHDTPTFFRFGLLYGFIGVALIVWARKAASVWPIRMDADMDVIAIRFSDEKYAGEFRKANSQATSRQLTDSPPFFTRPLFWKIVCVVALLAFVGHMVNR